MKSLLGFAKPGYLPLPRVVYDREARDGTWCCLPYPGHPKGCPNFPRCPNQYRDFMEIQSECSEWYAVVEEYDLKAHAYRMKGMYPWWTSRQCRNPLYWQGKVRARLRRKANPGYPNRPNDRIIMKIPEACGVNVFETMAQIGIVIDRYPDIVRKVMMIGRRK